MKKFRTREVRQLTLFQLRGNCLKYPFLKHLVLKKDQRGMLQVMIAGAFRPERGTGAVHRDLLVNLINFFRIL